MSKWTFGLDFMARNVGIAKNAQETINAVNTNLGVKGGPDLTMSGYRNSKVAGIHDSGFMKGLNNLAGIGANPVPVGSTIGEIDFAAKNLRTAQTSAMGTVKGKLDVLRKDPATHREEIARLEGEHSALQRDKAMSYVGQGLAYGKRFAQHTLLEGSTTDRLKKVGIYGGAYMGLNMAGRAATGGGLTYNSSGERDIAGIPLI